MIAQQKRLGYSTYTIIRKSDQKKLGTCGLYDREGIEGLDIGFALLPKFEGQGYAFEASRSLMHAAFHDFGLEQVSAITLEHNLASRKLLEKLGLQLVGKTCLPGGNEQLLLHRIDALYYNTTS